jgi:hypothetical protein
VIVRTFFTVDEAIDEVGGDENLLYEMIDFHGLRIYLNANRINASHMDDDGFMEDTLNRNGSHEFAEWSYHKKRLRTDDDPTDIHRDEYILSGWFECSEANSLAILRHTRNLDLRLTSFVDGKRYGTFFGIHSHVPRDKARIKAADIVRLMQAETDVDNAHYLSKDTSASDEMQANQALAIMAWMLAKTSKYKYGEKPNVKAIVEAMEPLIAEQFGEDEFAIESFRKRLGRALKTLG